MGKPIRRDVRSAAQDIWGEACRKTQALLADPGYAAEIMENTVAQVSRYLDRNCTSLFPPKHGLLMMAFSRSLRRQAARSRRLESIGGANQLSDRAVDYGWSRQIDKRLDLESVVRNLTETNSTVLALRSAGYEWKEVAELLGASAATVRNGFWREVRRRVGKPGR
jgi:predicted transcriptional regulator